MRALNKSMNDCSACEAYKNPSRRIKDYQFWFLEHIAEPVPAKGWLVLRTKEHIEGIVGMGEEEAKELGEILNTLPKALKETIGAEQIYVCCFTELVSHLHLHFIPRMPEDQRRTIEFFLLQKEVKEGKLEPIASEEVAAFIESLKTNI